jgi:hypothetical protein
MDRSCEGKVGRCVTDIFAVKERYIIASTPNSPVFSLVRASSDDDGEIIGTGSRAAMILLRDELLSRMGRRGAHSLVAAR